jgi:uncharacterized protein YaaN involved in tellurite resistance
MSKEKENIKVENQVKESNINLPVEVEVEVIPEDNIHEELSSRADQVIEEVIKANANYSDSSKAITSIGSKELNEISELSQILDSPLKNIMGEKNSPQESIAKSLIEIKTQADEISPNKFDLNPGFFGKLIAKITGNSSVNKYATKFASTKDIIQSIVESLDYSIIKLKEDNAILEQDKARFRKASDSLKKEIQLLFVIDKKIEEQAEKEQNEEIKNFLLEEVLFNVRNHLQDIQQTYVASQQGVAALNILIKNNKELIRGVERTKRATIPVISIGFTIATGLASQKKILDLTNDINNMTSDTMVRNSQMIKEQGASIQKQAASSTLDIEKITQSMNDLMSAIDDVENFKRNALPDMKESVNKLQELSNIIDNKISKFDSGERIEKETLSIEK